jgi:hypothetical protein
VSLARTGNVMGWMVLLKTAHLLEELRLDQQLRSVASLSLVVVVDADETGTLSIQDSIHSIFISVYRSPRELRFTKKAGKSGRVCHMSLCRGIELYTCR